MNLNSDKMTINKIIPITDKVKVAKNRVATNSTVDENIRLIEDEVSGIIKTGTGWCFYKHQLEAIKNKLKDKLTPEVFKTFDYKFDGYCFTITIKRPRKKQARKNAVVTA